MLRFSATAAGLALGAFHVWLFGHQAWTGQLEYAESLRWVTALGLVGGLALLRRQGTSLLRDRKATAAWVLAALLHGPVLADQVNLAAADNPSSHDAVTTVTTQLVAAVLGLGLALAAGRAPRREWAPARAALGQVRLAPVTYATAAHATVGFLPRPPPAR